MMGEIDETRHQLREDCISVGESVKGSHLQVVYSSPRVTWDTKGLDGYAIAHPEITIFRREGKPSASIRNRE